MLKRLQPLYTSECLDLHTPFLTSACHALCAGAYLYANIRPHTFGAYSHDTTTHSDLSPHIYHSFFYAFFCCSSVDPFLIISLHSGCARAAPAEIVYGGALLQGGLALTSCPFPEVLKVRDFLYCLYASIVYFSIPWSGLRPDVPCSISPCVNPTSLPAFWLLQWVINYVILFKTFLMFLAGT